MLKKVYVILMSIILCLCFSSNSLVYAQESESKQNVRVGFYQWEGYHIKDEDGRMSGAGYDFLHMISGYVDFDYEYVGYDKTWSEMFQMLEDGEIDMLTSVQYSDERAEKVDYSESPIGYSEAILTTTANQNKLEPGNYDSYNNMRVGMMTESSQNEKLFEYAQKHNFTFTPVYYSSQEAMEEALQKGTDIDAMVSTSIRTLGNELILERFDRAPYYVAVKKGDTELMDKINYAINKLNEDNPSWSIDLYTKYYSQNEEYLILSPEERNYLEQLKKSESKIRVLVNPDLGPYSYFENGQAKGILVDYFNAVCELYDIQADYIKTETAEEYLQAVRNKEADIVLAPNFIRYEADRDGYNLTQPFMNASLCMITRMGEKQDGKFSNKKIGIVKGMSSAQQLAEKDFPEAEITFYNTADDCINALRQGEISGVLLYEYTAYQYMNMDWKNEMQIFNMSETVVDFLIAVSKECDSNLYSLLNNGIHSISDSKKQSIILPTIFEQNSMDESLFTYIARHPAALHNLIIICFILVLMIVILISRKYNIRQKERRKKAEYKATHDALTGAINRLGYESILKDVSEVSKKIGVMLLDIDYFKNVNDTYGHSMGDQVLKQLVKLLKAHFDDADLVIRMGGDEFIVIIEDCEKENWDNICHKLNNIHQGLYESFSEKIALSISAGLCFSQNGINKEIISKADEALYNTKKAGRAGCTLVDENGKILEYWKDNHMDYASLQILEKHQLNAWQMIVNQSGTRMLYAQEGLYECLKLSKNDSAEKVYNKWFNMIADEEKVIFESMYEDMKEGNTSEIAVSWLHPTKGPVYIRFGGRKVKTDNYEDTFAGYYQILTGINILSDINLIKQEK